MGTLPDWRCVPETKFGGTPSGSAQRSTSMVFILKGTPSRGKAQHGTPSTCSLTPLLVSPCSPTPLVSHFTLYIHTHSQTVLPLKTHIFFSVIHNASVHPYFLFSLTSRYTSSTSALNNRKLPFVLFLMIYNIHEICLQASSQPIYREIPL